jgi:Domain of unknown function (DUF4326)
MRKGLCVVANLRKKNGRGLDDALLAWAAAEGRLIKADRKGPWANPFVIGEDGDRAEVIAKFKQHYWPHKTGLQSRREELRGKVLACWCHPEPCHCNIIAEAVNKPEGYLSRVTGNDKAVLDEMILGIQLNRPNATREEILNELEQEGFGPTWGESEPPIRSDDLEDEARAF